MPKRMCPSEYDYFPQFKKHISDKVGNLAMDTQNMQVVYSKTMDMLFKGARVTTAVDNHSTSPVHHDAKQYKQMFLNHHCQLENNGPTVSSQPNNICGSCHAQNNSSTHCSFCEKIVCSDCAKACIKCSDSFCSSCSLERLTGTNYVGKQITRQTDFTSSVKAYLRADQGDTTITLTNISA